MKTQEIEISVKSKDERSTIFNPIKFNTIVGATLKDELDRVGEAVVFETYLDKYIINRQADARNLSLPTKTRQAYTPEEIRVKLKEIKPELAGPKRTLKDKTEDLFSKLSKEEQAEIIKKFNSKK